MQQEAIEVGTNVGCALEMAWELTCNSNGSYGEISHGEGRMADTEAIYLDADVLFPARISHNTLRKRSAPTIPHHLSS